MKIRTLADQVLLTGAVLALCAPVWAQPYPARSVRLIVPFSAGSGVDIQARVLAREMQERLGQSFIVDNRAGAAGVLGTGLVAAAAPDGHTMLFTSAVLAISMSFHASRKHYKPVKLLTPISLVTSTPLVLIVHPGLSARSAQELIENCRRRPTLLNAAINFTGSTSHLSAELFKQLAGLKFATVAYKSGGFSMVAVMGGEVDFQFAEGVLAARQLQATKVRALAVTTAQPSEFFPGLPTMHSLLPGFVMDDWYAMYVPAGTRKEIVAAVNGALRNALETKFVRAFLTEEALTAVGSTPEDLETHLQREVTRYGEIVRKGNITLD